MQFIDQDSRCALPMPNLTQILKAVDAGDQQAAAELLPLVYQELRRLAKARLSNEQPGQTLSVVLRYQTRCV